ncbi:hypothetical protein ACFLRX_04840 [Acidobacteriota bacterium]
MKKIFTAAILTILLSFTVGSSSQWRKPPIKRKIRHVVSMINQTSSEWMRVYGSSEEDQAYSIVQNNDGGYLVSGYTREGFNLPQYHTACFLMNLSPTGNVVWEKFYYEPFRDWQNDAFFSIQNTSQGGFIAAGDLSRHITYDFLIAKFFSNGEPEWIRSFDTVPFERADCIRETSDGGYIVIGPIITSGHPDFLDSDSDVDLLVIKISTLGDIEWWNIYGGSKQEGDYKYDLRHAEIIQTSDGGYLLASETDSFGESAGSLRSFLLIKLSSRGSIEWANTYGGKGSELPSANGPHILETNQNTYIVGCSSNSFSDSYGIWLLELDLDGSIIQQKLFDTDSTDSFNSIIQSREGGYIIAGTAYISPSYGADFMLLKLSSSLNLEWAKAYGESYNEIAKSIIQTQDGGYVIAGFSGGGDIVVLKVPETGDFGSNCDLLRTPEITISETNIIPLVSDVSMSYSGLELTSNIIPFPSSDSNFKQKIICWNLNQAPNNVVLTREVNRSLFRGEAWNTITWDSNSLNSRFNISGYRVYRKETGESDFKYSLLATVLSSTFKYVDYYLKIEDKFSYFITSVDENGNESPWSIEVGNTVQ